jgi:hypothetical protein
MAILELVFILFEGIKTVRGLASSARFYHIKRDFNASAT